MRNFEQTWRIKRLLAEKGETISSLSRKLDRPVGSVANNIYGYRASAQLQREIADFLGRSVAELFEAADPSAAKKSSPWLGRLLKEKYGSIRTLAGELRGPWEVKATVARRI